MEVSPRECLLNIWVHAATYRRDVGFVFNLQDLVKVFFQMLLKIAKRKTNGPIESLSSPKKKEDTIEID